MDARKQRTVIFGSRSPAGLDRTIFQMAPRLASSCLILLRVPPVER